MLTSHNNVRKISYLFIITFIHYSIFQIQSVRQLLESCQEGKLVIASYGENKKCLRNKLTELIIKNELKQNTNKK